MEEPSEDVGNTTELVIEELFPSDPELPTEYYVQTEVDELEEAGIALESIHETLMNQGMSLTTARALEQYVPNYVKSQGGTQSFTSKPSLEGLADGVAAVKKRLMQIIAAVRNYVANLYKRFKAWLLAKFAKPEVVDVKPEVKAFVARRQNEQAMTFMADLPEDLEKAAYEVATLAGGDMKAFSTELTNQLGGVAKAAASIEKQLVENPTYFRLATGVVSVKELFKENAEEAIVQLFNKAANTAHAAMKTRNYEEFKEAVSAIDIVTKELQEFEQGFVVNDTAQPEQGEGKPVRLDTLFKNISLATTELERVDIKALVAKITGGIEHVIDISDNTKLEEIVEMIPEDVPPDQQSVMAQKIASLYRRVSKLGADVLRLWKLRADSVTTLNSVGVSLIKLVDSFEKAIAACGSTLDDAQKDKLVRALAAKGFAVEF